MNALAGSSGGSVASLLSVVVFCRVNYQTWFSGRCFVRPTVRVVCPDAFLYEADRAAEIRNRAGGVPLARRDGIRSQMRRSQKLEVGNALHLTLNFLLFSNLA